MTTEIMNYEDYVFDSILRRLPPPIEEFLTPNYIYNKVKPQPEYNHFDNLYKTLNFLPCEIINKIIYQNKGIMTPTAKLINEITNSNEGISWEYNEGLWIMPKIFSSHNSGRGLFNRHQPRVLKKRYVVSINSTKKTLQEILTNNGIKYKKSCTKKKLLFNYFVNNNDKLTNEGVKEAIQIEITPTTIKDKIFTEI